MSSCQSFLRRAALAERAAESLSAFPEFQARLLAQAREWRRLADAGPDGAPGEAPKRAKASPAKVPQGISSCVAAWAVLLSGAGGL